MNLYSTCLKNLEFGLIDMDKMKVSYISSCCFLLLVLKIFVRFTANAFRVEILGNFVIMYLEHLILIKMGSLISKNFSFQLMLHQPEHRRKNSSGLSGKT